MCYQACGWLTQQNIDVLDRVVVFDLNNLSQGNYHTLLGFELVKPAFFLLILPNVKPGYS